MKFGVVNWEILFFKVTVFFHWNLEFENLNVNLLVGTVQGLEVEKFSFLILFFCELNMF